MEIRYLTAEQADEKYGEDPEGGDTRGVTGEDAPTPAQVASIEKIAAHCYGDSVLNVFRDWEGFVIACEERPDKRIMFDVIAFTDDGRAGFGGVNQPLYMPVEELIRQAYESFHAWQARHGDALFVEPRERIDPNAEARLTGKLPIRDALFVEPGISPEVPLSQMSAEVVAADQKIRDARITLIVDGVMLQYDDPADAIAALQQEQVEARLLSREYLTGNLNDMPADERLHAEATGLWDLETGELKRRSFTVDITEIVVFTYTVEAVDEEEAEEVARELHSESVQQQGKFDQFQVTDVTVEVRPATLAAPTEKGPDHE